MAMNDMPAADVEITEDLVRALLDEQHPDLADLDIRLIANGWDNAIFRLGDELGVRLPRRRQAAELIAHETRWLPQLAPRFLYLCRLRSGQAIHPGDTRGAGSSCPGSRANESGHHRSKIQINPLPY